MTTPDRPADRIVRIMQSATAAEAGRPEARIAAGTISVRGNGNVLGDHITIRAEAPRRHSPGEARMIRASAITFIRRTAKGLGSPDLYKAFAVDQFGDDDLDSLTTTELERIRGWMAARWSQFHGG